MIGKTKSRAIAIPEGIDHFDQVLETVSSLRPVRVRTIEQWQKYHAFMAAGLLLYLVMLWAISPVVVIPLSLATGSVIVWVFFWIRRNPNIPGSSKRIAWIYWLFFVVCVLKLLVAVAGVESVKTYATVGKTVGNLLIFSPCVLLTFGWVRWWRVRPPRYWRNYAIGVGLGRRFDFKRCASMAWRLTYTLRISAARMNTGWRSWEFMWVVHYQYSLSSPRL